MAEIGLHVRATAPDRLQYGEGLRAPAAAVVGCAGAAPPLSAWAVDQSLNGPSDSIGHAWIYA